MGPSVCKFPINVTVPPLPCPTSDDLRIRHGQGRRVLHSSCCGAMILPGRAELRRPNMGLLDILNTIQNTMPPGGGKPSDPRARTTPGSAAGGQGTSPMAKALLA